MDGVSPGLVDAVILQVLELLADAYVARRLTVKESPAFHRLTGVIAAYGNALTLLVALQKQEECKPIIEHLTLPPSTSEYPLPTIIPSIRT